MTKRREVEGHSICTHSALKFESVEELKTHSSRTHRKYKFACECEKLLSNQSRKERALRESLEGYFCSLYFRFSKTLIIYFTCCFYSFVYLFLFRVLEGESTCVHQNIMFESSEHLRIHTFNEHKKYEYYCQCRNAFPTKAAAMDQHFNELHCQ